MTQSIFGPKFAVIAVALVMVVLFLGFQWGKSSTQSESSEIASKLAGENERTSSLSSNGRRPTSIEVVSWEPRVFIFHQFLSEEECDYIVNIGEPKISKSHVVGADGKPTESSHRTSFGTFLQEERHDPVVRRIEERIANTTFIPFENGEAMYLLKYAVGQEYKPHYDWFHGAGKQSTQRMATIIMYLSDVEEGGGTQFPHTSKTVMPKKGDATFFYNMVTQHKEDDKALHAGLPVIKGTKWAMTKWLRDGKFG